MLLFFSNNRKPNVEYLLNQRKNISSHSSPKIKYYSIAITAGVTIAILIAVATLVPLMIKSKSTTKMSTVPISSEF